MSDPTSNKEGKNIDGTGQVSQLVESAGQPTGAGTTASRSSCNGTSSSNLLQQEKRHIAYPMALQKQKFIIDSDVSATALGVGSHAIGSGSGSGSGSKPAPNNEKPSYVSCLDERNIKAPPHDESLEKTSYLPYLESSPTTQDASTSQNEYDPIAEIQPLPEQVQQNPQQQVPGAYPIGAGEERGRRPDGIEEPTTLVMSMQEEEKEEDHDYNAATLARSIEESDGTLAEALPVESGQFGSRMMEAQPVSQENRDQLRAVDGTKDKNSKRLAFAFVAVACLVLVLSLAIGLTNKKEPDAVVVDKETAPPTGSPTRPLPPMENLEMLYKELPEKTKESLFKSDSPQHEAWEWLLHHPDISTMREWRKKQIFAMATFFFSFDGPNWPETTPAHGRWMDVSTSECSWVLSDAEVAYFTQQSINILGSRYGYQDWQPCNDDGVLQNLLLYNLYLPNDVRPSIPPEIELLPSLRFLIVFFSQISGRLSDFLAPEIVELPRLEHINYHSCGGLTGTIPTEIALMTGLRHFLIGANSLTGTIPSQLINMSSLEFFSLNRMKSFTGKLPSELGLMTQLTGIEIYQNSFTGLIPTELGLLTDIEKLALSRNELSCSIPSELLLLTSTTHLTLDANHLTGSISTELGLMTDMRSFRVRNNALGGSIPSELGLMTNAIQFWLGNDLSVEAPYNTFSGSLPQELWYLSHLEDLFLPNLPNLHGIIPTDIMMYNLTHLRLSGSVHLSGTIPEHFCHIRELNFDCGDLLCGCDCQCFGGGKYNQTNPYERN